MKKQAKQYPETLIGPAMIAPCGMNCAICIGYLRERNPCPGCGGSDDRKPRHCVICRIKNCPELEATDNAFGFECSKFPCARLRRLDNRYRTKYRMSMIDNLQRIRELGLDGYIDREKERWKCPECGGIVCVHRDDCLTCSSSTRSTR